MGETYPARAAFIETEDLTVAPRHVNSTVGGLHRPTEVATGISPRSDNVNKSVATTADNLKTPLIPVVPGYEITDCPLCDGNSTHLKL